MSTRKNIFISLAATGAVVAGASAFYLWRKYMAKKIAQTTNKILMVAPSGFKLNRDAMADNKFMNDLKDATDEEVTKRAVAEHIAFRKALTDVGVKIELIETKDDKETPDAVFPNNWFTTHSAEETKEKTLVLYPMKVANRRLERRPTIIEMLKKSVTKTLDITKAEEEGKALEGTGSMVLDRANKICYALLSPRTEESVIQNWAKELGYTLVLFKAQDKNKQPIYHTNVMMAIGTSLAVVCPESVPDEKERKALMDSLSAHRKVLTITLDQVAQFCGNVLEVQGDDKHKRVMLMSDKAFKAFTEEEKKLLQQHTDAIVHTNIDTIEFVGGGGARCMCAELFV
eukprot:TRINITY_DN10475_c0_g1_i1.p1 TRINITY_DN10475_c0_g1~~TRINITY_DN10475_c0_g1_i1.p1  ORF type:complete len:343 (+),score=110.52 TRINITY_DN10475_c0_g1_i1:55-1083(+)